MVNDNIITFIIQLKSFSTNVKDLEDFSIIIMAMIWKSYLRCLLAKKKMLRQSCHKLFKSHPFNDLENR